MAMMFGEEFSTRAYEHIAACLRTGTDGVGKAYGKHIWEVLAERPGQCETFQNAMTNSTAVAAQAIVEAYDFSAIKRLADVGGGHGLLLASILRAYPRHARRAVRPAGGGRVGAEGRSSRAARAVSRWRREASSSACRTDATPI